MTDPTTEDEAYPFDVPCPICKSDNTTALQRPLDIPNFPNHYLFTFKCNDCQFRHNDFFSIDPQDPKRLSYVAKGKEDWTTKIVRSGSATINVPLLGALIEPGPSSEGRITNIEGIIRDIREKVVFLAQNSDTLEERENAANMLVTIDRLLAQFGEIEVIIDDPMGNSLILPFDPSKLHERKLTEEEVSKLQTGYFTL